MRLMQEFKEYPPIHQIFAQIQDQKDAVFLDSSLTNQLGRHSIVGLHPYLKLVKGAAFTVNGKASADSFEYWTENYLKSHREKNPTGLPLISGAIGYFSYDYGREKEGVASRHPRELDIPDSILVFYDSFIIEDHARHRLHLVAGGHGQNPETAMAQMKSLLLRAEKAADFAGTGFSKGASVTANFTKHDYMDAVRRMIQYIVEGDIYIANMTQQLEIASAMPPFEMFQNLRACSPAWCAALFWNGFPSPKGF